MHPPKVELWPIEKLLRLKDSIVLNPAYQRGPAWNCAKQALLLDTIFRDYDLPKFYFAKSIIGGATRFEVVDGQQRLRSIFELHDGERILDAESVGRAAVGAKLNITDLTTIELKRFNRYKLTISIIDSPTSDYKRTLFTRLQLGERLNPAELRNALESSAPRQFRTLATNHEFFSAARIEDKRYKRDDYITHVFALLYFESETKWQDIKAPSLKQFVLARCVGIKHSHLRLVSQVLDFMKEICDLDPKKSVFKNKWTFVDTAFYLCQRFDRIKAGHARAVLTRLETIESLRKEYYRNSERLLESSVQIAHKTELFHYIQAYKAGGAVRSNIEARLKYLNAVIKL